jgi:hypothetical protein
MPSKAWLTRQWRFLLVVDALGSWTLVFLVKADNNVSGKGWHLAGDRRNMVTAKRVVLKSCDAVRGLARELKQHDGYELQTVKRKQRAFKIAGLAWIVERSFAWLGRYRPLSKDNEFSVQTSGAMIDIAARRLILNRIATAQDFSDTL